MPSDKPAEGRIVQRNVQSYTSNRGKRVHYYRRGDFRVRLPDDATGPDFAEAWAAADRRWQALQAPPSAGRASIRAGSVAALIADYKASPEHTGLAPKTRTDYARMLDELAAVVVDHCVSSSALRTACAVKMYSRQL